MNTPLQQLLLKLKSVFPEAVTETKRVDDYGKPYIVYALKDEFISQLQKDGLDIVSDQNRYELQFPGKNAAKAQAFVPSYKTLVAGKEQSKDFDNTSNVFIEGDNLDALRMLQNSYRDKIKVIYIDPPYNTGGDGFTYNDDFSIKQKKYLQAVGILDEDGERQISELKSGLRGRFHAGWLTFMYPRLKLARELLMDDGVIFISIDDNEQANLKLLCDEIFGEENFVNSFAVARRVKSLNSQFSEIKTLNQGFEYIVAYRKSYLFSYANSTKEAGSNRKEGYWNSFWNSPDRPTMRYSLGGHIITKGQWKWSEERAQRALDNYNIFMSEANNEDDIKEYYMRNKDIYYQSHGVNLEFVKPTNTTVKYWVSPSDVTIMDTNMIDYYVNDDTGRRKYKFDTAKNPQLIKKIIDMAAERGDIVLDFFAGSATTAHAVMQLNAEDGGNRKFIMIQLAEEIDKKSKEAYDFCTETLKRPATIAEISKERIRRAGAQIAADNPDKQLDTGFRVLSVCDSPLSKNNPQPLTKTTQAGLLDYQTNLTPDIFTELLYEALLKTGRTLDLPLAVHKADGYPFAICDKCCYCVTENLTQDIVRKIAETHSETFDILYYLSDCPTPQTSYTELESVIKLMPGDKKIQSLNFY